MTYCAILGDMSFWTPQVARPYPTKIYLESMEIGLKLKQMTQSKFAFSIFAYLALGCATAHAITPEEMLKRADEARRPQGMVTFTATITDLGSGSKKETRYQVSAKTRGTDALSLVNTIFPERLKGRKLLMLNSDLWLYLPTIKRPTRISVRERLSGEVANGDISHTNFAGDYDAVQKGTEKIGNKMCIKLALTAKNKDVTYSKIDYWLDAKTYAPVRAAFYALSGKLLKTGDYSGAKPVLGSIRMTRLWIKDALQPTHQSILEFSNFERQDLPDSLFNKESLSD